MNTPESSRTDAIVVLCACGSELEARKIAEALVQSRSAACVNLLSSMRSVYRWKGAVESADEWLLTIKSTAEHFDAIQQTVTRLHSYEVPEIIALPIVAGSAAYMAWLREQVSGP